MSITALVTGKLIADPDRRIGGSGKPFVLARVAAHDGEAEAIVSLIGFGSIADQLGAMTKGDAVAVTGRAKVKAWTSKDGEHKAGLSLTVDAVLTAYHVRRKRQAVVGEAPASAPAERQAPKPPVEDQLGQGQDAWLVGGAP